MYRYQRLQRVAEEEGDKADELQVYADFLRIVLEILNCILVTNLPANPELVYAMLHQQEIFMPFQVSLSVSSWHRVHARHASLSQQGFSSNESGPLRTYPCHPDAYSLSMMCIVLPSILTQIRA